MGYFENCVGQQINLPPGGKIQTFLKGSTVRLKWNYTSTSTVRLRYWTFTSSDGKFSDITLAEISRDKDPTIETKELNVKVEKPATLILNNVNITYNGTYQFYLTPLGVSTVNVFIAGKLKWTRITGFFKIACHFIIFVSVIRLRIIQIKFAT